MIFDCACCQKQKPCRLGRVFVHSAITVKRKEVQSDQEFPSLCRLFDSSRDGFGDFFQFAQRVFCQVEMGGAHGRDWIAGKQLSVAFRSSQPIGQLAFATRKFLQKGIWACK
ncbi:MAG: hypothetical protein ACHP79_05795 [Terriglobales bacterium]